VTTLTDGEAPKNYEQHLSDLQAIAASGAADWALAREVNEGHVIAPADLGFRPGFLEGHFGMIRNVPEND
jgi:hypothetical protein